MAQRNPMNERYQGDGPQGKTRKSAAKLKPKSQAASSVYIEKKPTTRQERKAAHKKREKQVAAKEAERKRKAEERERQARIDAGLETEEPKNTSVIEKVKGFFVAPKPSETTPKQDETTSKSSKVTSKSSKVTSKSSKVTSKSSETTLKQDETTSKSSEAISKSSETITKPRTKVPNTPEYRRLKRIYWVLMGIGVAAMIVSFIINFNFPGFMDGWGMMVPMGVAYATVISAIVLDYAKIRKLQRAHVATAGGRMSPKQQKHEQEKAEAAALLEESKKSQRELKRANSKVPFIRKSSDSSEKGKDASKDATKKTADSTTEEAKEAATKSDAADMPSTSNKSDASNKNEE